MDLTLSSADRVAIVGKTGSGKTVLASSLLAPVKRLVVFDPKGAYPGLQDPAWNLETWSDRGRRELLDGKDARVRVPAPLDGDWRPYLAACWEMRDVTLYIDELYGVVPPGKKPPDELVALYTRGRELSIGVWAATQRPVWVPLFAISEADWLFTFRLNLPDDRHRMAQICGPAVEEPITDQYGFWMYSPVWNEPLYTSGLDLSS